MEQRSTGPTTDLDLQHEVSFSPAKWAPPHRVPMGTPFPWGQKLSPKVQSWNFLHQSQAESLLPIRIYSLAGSDSRFVAMTVIENIEIKTNPGLGIWSWERQQNVLAKNVGSGVRAVFKSWLCHFTDWVTPTASPLYSLNVRNYIICTSPTGLLWGLKRIIHAKSLTQCLGSC